MGDNFDRKFKYHEVKEGQDEKYNNIRATAKQFALLIEQSVPDSREKSLAITKVEEAMMWANSGIARNE